MSVFVCAVLLAAPCRAELVLDPEAAPFAVARFAEATQVELHDLSEGGMETPYYPIEDMLEKAASGAFEPVETRHIGSGLSGVANYVRVPIRSISDEPTRWVLASNRSPGYYFKAHLVLDDGSAPSPPVFEFNFATDQWTDDDVLLHTEFVMPPRSAGYLYIAYESLNGGAPMTIETVDGYAAKRRAQDLLLAAVVGIALGLVTTTVALMATLRRSVAIYYAGAVLSGLIVVLVSEHYLFALFPQILQWGDHDTILPYAAAAGPTFALLFQRQFFADVGGTGKFLGHLNLFAGLSCILSVVGTLEFEIVPPEVVIISLALSIPLITVNGIVALRRGYPGRWPFFFGAVIFSLSFMVKVLSYEFSAMISSREASLVLLYSIALEAMFLSLTLYLQVRNLRHLKEQALIEQVETAKTNLRLAQSMSHAAHDIQQPLSSLRLALSSSATLDGREQDFHKAIDYLESIVSRQLAAVGSAHQPNTGHADAATTDMVEPFEMNVVLRNVAIMFSEEATRKGLKFRVVDCSAVVETNVFAVTRVLANLAANAIRNTQTGTVLIGCRRRDNVICLDVYDTGKGFAEHEIEALQAPHARNGDYPGKGLGLSIVRTLCREHGLGFDLASQPGAGAHFRVRLPRPSPSDR
ncbi:sensor histidine kinase [Loktanella sp. IMCC34160]|uniref:sensor histidine kinase n=1 Tax=Loktanella sp. IMCC34160 TaxID=2510646 RepID=UPI0013EC9C93|nr:sensor histidine kinase [Loktanella sp. IMCC34160]